MLATDTAVATAALAELAAVWKLNGVEVIPPSGSNFTPETAVTLILVETLPPADAGRSAVGWIGFVGPEPQPVIRVSLRRAHAQIDAASVHGTRLSSIPEVLRQQLIIRVIGRAAAHELGHYLLASRSHAVTGLMRFSFTPEQLVGDSYAAFTLRPDERVLLAARLRDARRQTGGQRILDTWPSDQAPAWVTTR